MVSPSLRGEMPVKPRKMMCAQGGRDSKSPCDSELTSIVDLPLRSVSENS